MPKGTFLYAQAALPLLRLAEYGRLILTSSITGPITGSPGWVHYGASNAAQYGFMRTAAIEFAMDDITVNAILPGNIVTEGSETRMLGTKRAWRPPSRSSGWALPRT